MPRDNQADYRQEEDEQMSEDHHTVQSSHDCNIQIIGCSETI